MKKLLSCFLAICTLVTCSLALCACDQTPPPATVYTVTEAEWRTNLNLTNVPSQAPALSCELLNASQPQLLANPSQPLTEITSYTAYAEGINVGTPGTALLKMTPEGMYVEFYVNGTLKESESGTFSSTETIYQSVKINMMMLVPFANSYNDFTFNETKKVYEAQDVTTTLVNDYDVTQTTEIFHKTAEVSFIDGYLNSLSFIMTDKTFTDVVATFTFTFSNINNTTI